MRRKSSKLLCGDVIQKGGEVSFELESLVLWRFAVNECSAGSPGFNCWSAAILPFSADALLSTISPPAKDMVANKTKLHHSSSADDMRRKSWQVAKGTGEVTGM